MEEDELDPRIQVELEKLNNATDDINKLEIELDEANTTFRMLLNECTRRLKVHSSKYGSAIESARPYYEALDIARKAQQECQQAAVSFQRANEVHEAAKETVTLAESRFLSQQPEWRFDSAWQEMLNHATIKVRDAEKQRAESSAYHGQTTAVYKDAQQKVHLLEQRLRRNVAKSRPYFEEKQRCNEQLAAQKEAVEALAAKVAKVKAEYAESLRQLEGISEEIHRKRGNLQLGGCGVREPGVGAELDYKEELEYCVRETAFDKSSFVGGGEKPESPRKVVPNVADYSEIDLTRNDDEIWLDVEVPSTSRDPTPDEYAPGFRQLHDEFNDTPEEIFARKSEVRVDSPTSFDATPLTSESIPTDTETTLCSMTLGWNHLQQSKDSQGLDDVKDTTAAISLEKLNTRVQDEIKQDQNDGPGDFDQENGATSYNKSDILEKTGETCDLQAQSVSKIVDSLPINGRPTLVNDGSGTNGRTDIIVTDQHFDIVEERGVQSGPRDFSAQGDVRSDSGTEPDGSEVTVEKENWSGQSGSTFHPGFRAADLELAWKSGRVVGETSGRDLVTGNITRDREPASEH